MKKRLAQHMQNKKWLGYFLIFLLLWFFIWCFLIIVSPADAAVGINKQINFQGKLVDSNGLNVADGSYTVVFSLYNLASGGSALWTETDTVTTSGGIFQVALGATTAFSGNIDFNSDSLYLGIKVNTDAEMTPRIRFTAVPYAFNADKLDGVVATQSATGFNLQGGTSGQSTVSFTTAGTTLTLQPGLAGGLTLLSNGANGLTLDTGGSAAVNIGTTNATSLVFGNSTTNPTFSFNGNGLTTFGGNLTIVGTTGINLSGNSADINFTGTGTDTLTTNNQTFAIMAGTGQVGINVSSGLISSFDVRGNSGTTSVESISGATSFAGLVVNNSGVGDLFTASKSGTTKFVIDTKGNVGIGTALPFAALDVRATSGTTPGASISGNTTFASMIVNNSGNGDIFTASSGGITRFRMSNNGSVVFQGDSLTSIGSGATNTTSGAVENHIGDTGSLIPNPGFDSAITGIGFSDGWAAAATNSAVVTRDTTVQAKGIASAKVTFSGASQSTAVYSTCIPLALQSGTGSYTLNYYAKPSVANRVVVRGYIDAYTSKGNCQANITPTFSAAQGGNLSSTSWATTGSGATAITFASGTNTWGRVHIFVGCPASCSGTTTVNLDGVRLIESANSVGLDYAEEYPADPTDIPEAGDVVSLVANDGTAMVHRAKVAMDQSVIGVVSTNPGEVLDDNISDPKVPVALAGRVPVKVSTINGPIHIGDYLTSSSIPGVAVKAIAAGPVIGTAMEDDTDADPSAIAEITMFIKNTYYNGNASDSGLLLTSGGQDASILLSWLQGFAVASESAFPSLATGKAGAGLTTLVSMLENKLNGSDSAHMQEPISPPLDTLSSSREEIPLLILKGLAVSENATVSGDFRVKGNGLFEGIIHVVDTLFANNFITNGIAEFFGKAIFHEDVTFEGKPTVGKDTAGLAVIAKGADHVEVTFAKPYEQIPVINASITLDPLTPTPNETKNEQEQRLHELEKTLLADTIHFIITKKSVNGFTILLDKPAGEDIAFSWFALAVQNAVIFQSNGISPLPIPTEGNSPTPFDTIMPTNVATKSANF